MTQPITVETYVPVPPEQAWAAHTDADAITRWNFASPDWHCPSAEVDLRAGGRHCARMEAKDGSFGFDYEGVYETVDAPAAFVLVLGAGRRVETTFTSESRGTRVRTVFDADASAPIDMQREGWQAILDNYAAFVRGEAQETGAGS